MATEILNTISKDEHAIAKYRARRKWEADLTTNLSVSRRLGKEEGILIGMEKGMEKGMKKGRQEGMEKGIQKGIQKGRQEGIQETIERFRRGGMSDEEINKFLH